MLMDREQRDWELNKTKEKNLARKEIVKSMGGVSTAPGSKRKPKTAKKEGSRRNGKRRKYDLIPEGWGAPIPHVDREFGSTDVRLRMGEGAATLDQEEQHSTLPGEELISSPSPAMELEGGWDIPS